MEAAVVGGSTGTKREDRLTPDESAASFGSLCASALVERFLASEMPQQFREIFAAQILAQSAVGDTLAKFMENRQSDVLFIGRAAFVRAELLASLADECSAAKLPQVRRSLFAAFAEFQVQPGDRSVFVEHA